MILTKEVEIGVSGNNIKFYEDKGYVIPRKKDKRGRVNFTKGVKINVKVEDLMPTSKAVLLCECEDCGIIRNIKIIIKAGL